MWGLAPHKRLLSHSCCVCVCVCVCVCSLTDFLSLPLMYWALSHQGNLVCGCFSFSLGTVPTFVPIVLV